MSFLYFDILQFGGSAYRLSGQNFECRNRPVIYAYFAGKLHPNFEPP